MRKLRVIAVREYLAAVRTKTFVIGLLLMPIMMGSSGLVQWLLRDVVDTRDKTFAVVDRTPGQQLLSTIERGVEEYNKTKAEDPKTHQQVKPHFKVLVVEPSSDTKAAIENQHLELSDQVREGKLRGFLEVRSKDVFGPGAPGLVPAGEDAAFVEVLYETNRPADEDFARYVKEITEKKVRDGLALRAGLAPAALDRMLRPVALKSRGLTTRDPETGQIKEASEESKIAALLMPVGLIALMFMVVFMSATPLMQGVVEEKMQRIAEVLLGSVRPFELMMGKLLGMVGVSLTISVVYLGGIYWLAQRFGFAEFLSMDLLAWFVLFQCLAALMYGSLFIAVGAACTDMKETQNLLWPVVLLAMLPIFFMGNVMREPNNPVVTGMSFFPLATPMLMIARQAIPPGLPWWQPTLGAVLVVATTLLCVYAAGRIFRVGILLQGKGARVSDIARWVLRG
jgi:ABC-type Na+ efflux pump permease subunit